jgi:tetratricopeptide (TPR) repeat protein
MADGQWYFSFTDLVCFKTAKELLDHGLSLAKMRSGLKDLERILPGVDKPLARLRISADGGGGFIVRKGRTPFDAHGQMLFDFSLKDSKGTSRVASLPQSTNPRYWFERGCSLDSNPATLDAAIEAYQNAIQIEPDFADALTNLGNGYYQKGDRERARDCYRKSLQVDPNHLAANFNMGNLLEEEGKLLAAIGYYKKTLMVDPLFADAHFNIGLTYEKLQMRDLAKPHWKKFIELDPRSEEAELARRFLLR